LLSILFGISSALSWGAGDFAGGLASRKIGAYRAVLFADFIGLIALLLIVAIVREGIPPLASLLFAGLAGMLGSLGLLILYYALAHGQMSIAAPVSALMAAALPVGIGALTQGLPTAVQFGGFGLALTAIWFISQVDSSSRLHLNLLADLRLPLLAGFGFGSYFVLMHYATDKVTAIYWPMIVSRVAGTLLLLVFVLWRRESFSVPSKAWTVILLNGFLDLGGNFFYILALKAGRLDIAAILSSLYPGSTVILAWLLLKEKISRLQLLGILCALGAITLLTI
jgi:drug/metabolite transporter (DMT)-like permease